MSVPHRPRLCAAPLALAALAAPRLALAAPAAPSPALAQAPALPAPYQVVLGDARAPLPTARQLVPDDDGPTLRNATGARLVQSRTIYLNRAGVTLQPASVNDARQNRSTIAKKPTYIPPWTVDAAGWSATVTCLREIFAPFAVRLVTEDPGNAPHLEAVFGGSPTLLDLPTSVAGVSPFSASCSAIEYSMVFVFTGAFTASPRAVCEVMAQEIAHSYGLDHELLAADPMSYLSYAGRRFFQEELASCGEYAARPCGLGSTPCRAKQSSLAILRERLGVADAVPPRGAFVEPLAGAVVESQFRVEVTASDDVAISEVAILLDGAPVDVLETAPFWLAMRDVPAGEHVVTALIVDQARNTTRATSTITVVPAEDAGLWPGCASTRRPASSAWVLVALLWWRRRAQRRASR